MNKAARSLSKFATNPSNLHTLETTSHIVPVWIQRFLLNPELRFLIFFFFPLPAALFDQVNREQCTRALFTNPQILLFNNFFIKNGSHDTIHTFKNYFATVFSVSVFSFSKNKLNPNGPIMYTVII